MAEAYPHLPLQREEPITTKRSGPGFPRPAPADPAEHGRVLHERLKEATNEAETDIGGFDQRRLFRFTVDKGFTPDDLRKVAPDLEFVSQEGEDVVVAFASVSALESFEARLVSLQAGEGVKYKQVLYALTGVTSWTLEDRTGWALAQEGLPTTAHFLLDVELWPLEEHPDDRQRLWAAFEKWLREEGLEWVDAVKNDGLTLYRVRCDQGGAQALLHHRDVRTVDLPPRYGLQLKLLYTDLQDLPDAPAPPDTAAGIAVLDSGLTGGHPLLRSAVGDSQSFIPDRDAVDENGHGTLVAGLALYGDVETVLRDGLFTPRLRLFSGRILDENNENDTGFVENHISDAVHYFNREYGCRIFNLSFGDRNKPYLGKHLRGLSYTLDTLSRDLGVLFVVSAGNVSSSQIDGADWRGRYPEYLQEPEWTLIEPAPALNALTVGSIARFDQTFNCQRWERDPAEVPIARRDQPSPFSRHGPSVGGAVKPDLVAYGGNWAVLTRGGANTIVPNSGLGELSFNRSFAEGRLFAEESGTSFAAPQVAHLAASILNEHREAGPELIRALLVAHATVPAAAAEVLSNSDSLRHICGYGRVDDYALFRSTEDAVTVTATDVIVNKCHHFYELPIPEEFVSNGRRLRELVVALGHTPVVRSTRVAYKATRMDFRVVAGDDLEFVSRMFSKATERAEYERIPELANASLGPLLRDKGTVQAATWCFSQFSERSILRRKRLFVVVTRNDFPWGESMSAEEEPYALVVCLRDRHNEQARLYTEIRERLQARTRARARA